MIPGSMELILACVLCSCVSGGPIASPDPGQTLRIGVLVSLTGPAGFVGEAQRNTAVMLAEALNSGGGIGGHEVELLIEDTASDPKVALAKAKDVLARGVVGIIGPSTSTETMAIRDLCQGAKVPLLSCGSGAGLVDPVMSYIFKTAPDDALVFGKLAAELERRGLRRLGVVAPWPVYPLFLELLGKHGIKTAFTKEYRVDDPDLSGFFGSIDVRSIDALAVWTYGAGNATAVRDARKAGIKLPIVVNESFGDEYHLNAAGEAGNGVLFPALLFSAWSALPDSNPSKALIKAFRDDYARRFRAEPTPYAAHMHDAFSLLAAAIRKAGTDPAAIRAALEGIRSFPGMCGEISLSAKDHDGLGDEAIEVIEVRNGAFALANQPAGAVSTRAAPAKYRETAAVLDFTLKGVDANDGRLYAELVRGALAETGAYQVLDTGRRDEYLSELEWSLSGISSDEDRLKAGRLLAARYLVTGSIGKLGSKYYLDMKLVETETTRIVSAYQASYASLEEMVDHGMDCVRALVKP